jgi:predicted peptidase
MRTLLMVVAFAMLVAGCGDDKINPTDFNILSNLPIDTGGVQLAKFHESTSALYGHYIYTPSSHSKEGPEFPLLIFLHGAGEKGNSSADPTKLDLVLRNGPPRMIKRGEWDPTYPMIVASPQCHDGGWNSEKIHAFIDYLIDEYSVNTRRIYVTGLSMGGYGTFSYIGYYGDDSYAAACVPICGGGNTNKAESFLNIPTWAFHGDADGTVSVNNSIKMIDAINVLNPPERAKLTIYPGVGHNSWSMTYDGSGMGTESSEYDGFNQKIYDWMFQYQKAYNDELIQ